VQRSGLTGGSTYPSREGIGPAGGPLPVAHRARMPNLLLVGRTNNGRFTLRSSAASTLRPQASTRSRSAPEVSMDVVTGSLVAPRGCGGRPIGPRTHAGARPPPGWAAYKRAGLIESRRQKATRPMRAARATATVEGCLAGVASQVTARHNQGQESPKCISRRKRLPGRGSASVRSSWDKADAATPPPGRPESPPPSPVR
jgi:hypothetical protein